MKYILTYKLFESKVLKNINIDDYDVYHMIPFDIGKNYIPIKGIDGYNLYFSDSYVYDYIKDEDITKALNENLDNIDITKDWTNTKDCGISAYDKKDIHVLRVAKLVKEILEGKSIRPVCVYFDESAHAHDIRNFIEDGNHRIRALQYLVYDSYPAYISGGHSKELISYLESLNESVGKEKISNVDLYTSQMKHTYIDKLFFLEKIKDIDCIVDFGCADGFILSEISRPDIKLIGYDLDRNMLSKARENNNSDVILTNDWNEVTQEISNYNNVCLNLSSVIHEVYSYSHASKVKEFWNNVFKSNFKYITIRDMIPSVEVQRKDWLEFLEDTKKVNKKANKKILKSFENRWGFIDNDYRTFLHFLLKYKYTDNWDREVNENYLPITLEHLKKKIPSNYSIIFEDDFILPYLRSEVKKDFDIEIKNSTHVKMILRKN